ncbi:NAD-dependent epimerase/dehydratase family protein [Candidatus Pelagibacter ubique]|nr:NAD-dependent epimerase/dehydratase family protein [Candidatus Pelagibacter ubique]
MNIKKNVVVTGCCGFIGFSLSQELLNNKNIKVIGLDTINDYYDVNLKKQRLKLLKQNKNFQFKKVDIKNYNLLKKIFHKDKIDIIYNFAAQAGVQYSIKNPKKYMDSNCMGFFNILELARKSGVKTIFYASSSSVYGDSKKFPVKENFDLKPKNFYGFSKKANEEMAEIYSRYYGIKTIGLRFFTVFGPWGRPDLVINKLIDSFFKNKIFYLNNFGKHVRDFTYIDDVIKIILKLSINNKNVKDCEIFNICGSQPVSLLYLIKLFKKKVGKPKIIKRAFQKGDILKSYGSNRKLNKVLGKLKFTNFDDGFIDTLEWYKEYYKIK